MFQDRALQWAVEQDIVKKAGRFGTEELPEKTEDLSFIEIPNVMERYVAGQDIDDVSRYVSGINEDGITAIVNELGEHYENPGQVEDVRQEYSELLQRIDEDNLDAHLSVKPTQLGLDVDRELCERNLRELARESEEKDRFFWIDMESVEYKEDTLDIYEDLNREFDNVGLCLQAYLEDTEEEDLERLQKEGGTVRLVKGAYDSDSDFESDEQVDERYMELMERMFEDGPYFALGTHDEDIIEKAKELETSNDNDTGKEDYEIQVLTGVFDGRPGFINEDHNLTEYVPYGDEAFDYFWRRVEEHPQNLKYGFSTVWEANRDLWSEKAQSMRDSVSEAVPDRLI